MKHRYLKITDYKFPHEARPRLDTLDGTRTFPNRRQAVEYLKKVTGYFLEAEDWAMIGKLRVIKD